MRSLYPEIGINHEYYLDVDTLDVAPLDVDPLDVDPLEVNQGHRLYVEECGNPGGIPVLFVHGGPGGGCSPEHRRFFNPERYRIILFDQRGCGRSTPHAELKDNSTQALISDMERIREFLSIDQWLLFGGSWGSTLSLVYAQAHPERVLGMILRGIFLCRDEDIHWFYQQGASALFPDYWQDYLEPIPAAEREDLLNAYYQRLTSSNELAQMQAAKAWSIWEGRCSTLEPKPGVVDHFGDPHFALAMARIEAHYFVHKAFLEPNQILRDAHKLADIPLTIVHGRYDVVCPLTQAHALHQVLPQARLHIVRNAGHSAFEPGIIDNLVQATDEFAAQSA